MSPNIEAQVTKIPAVIYQVTWRYEQAPLDEQVRSFASDGLKVISPSQLAFAQTYIGNGTFEYSSRTTGDVFYDARNNKFVIFPEGTIRDLVGIVNIVDAHKQGKEYVIPQNQRDRMYAIADKMLKKGTAVAVNPGQTNVDTSKFGEVELTDILYYNRGMGFEAGTYGQFLKDEKRMSLQSFILDDEGYAKSRKGPYVNVLKVLGRFNDFMVVGHGRTLYDYVGAFGAHFEKAAEGGAKK